MVGIAALILVAIAASWMTSRGTADQPAVIAQRLLETVASRASADELPATLSDADRNLIASDLPTGSTVESVSVSQEPREDRAYVIEAVVATDTTTRKTVTMRLAGEGQMWHADVMEIRDG